MRIVVYSRYRRPGGSKLFGSPLPFVRFLIVGLHHIDEIRIDDV